MNVFQWAGLIMLAISIADVWFRYRGLTRQFDRTDILPMIGWNGGAIYMLLIY